MGFRCGIVGLPNVGKSTLFNALTNSSAAEAANYPFCTIQPNVGSIAVPDSRLLHLAQTEGSAKILSARMEFVDIAGLVKGAHKGEGLGNQFLSHIREADAIVYVLRCFEDSDITHVEGRVNPILDAEIIKMELALSDIESLQRRLPNIEKKAKQDKTLIKQIELIQLIINQLSQNLPIQSLITKENTRDIQLLQLLSSKPFFYVSNVEEKNVAKGNAYSQQVDQLALQEKTANIVISAKIEAEIANLTDEEEKTLFLQDLGLTQSGLAKIATTGYRILGLNTFFTVGPKEAHAWTINQGFTAPQAAGVIHTDFQRGFICAEIIGYDDYATLGNSKLAKEAGKLRLEGKDYIMQEGDIVHFRFNV